MICLLLLGLLLVIFICGYSGWYYWNIMMANRWYKNLPVAHLPESEMEWPVKDESQKGSEV